MDNGPSGQIDSLRYRFYSTEEIKSLSVCKVTNDFTFDKFSGRGVDNGLHDVKFGVKLPGNPKQSELIELEGLTKTEQRQIAIRNLFTRPRVPCKLCGSSSWVVRHANRQQIVIRPVSVIGNARMRSGKTKGDFDEDCDDLLEHRAPEDLRIAPNIASGSKTDSIFIDMNSETEASKLEADYIDYVNIVRTELSDALKNTKEMSVMPELARVMLKCLWTHDSTLLRLLFPMLNAASNHKIPVNIFFMDAVLLTPSLCRWPRHVGGLAYEHPETAIYVRVVRRAQCLQNIVDFIDQQDTKDSNSALSSLKLSLDSEVLDATTTESQRTAEGALRLAIVLLQAAVNGIYDSNMSTMPVGLESKVVSASAAANAIRLPGIKQRLEKKEGLFRMHMMGKRVNFACRSVISPDPDLSVTEVGVPLYFARRLTFPTPVTMFNLSQLRQFVINGPNVYPGARSLQFSDGRLILLPHQDTPQAKKRREMLARRLAPLLAGTHSAPMVHRHLLAGDMLVMNRQPTLHRPSMQAHRVRIINCTGAKTLRMHYSNCKAYNADFDGDEMNGHLVQGYAAQAELESLASVPHQYLVPKDGTPLAGLIQDHVIAAVKLTMRDRFLEYSDYMDLVYHALRPIFSASRHTVKGPPQLILLKPAICWPKRLWTGKQVISTLLMNLTPPNLPHLNATLIGRRTKAELWSGASVGSAIPLSDVDLVICDGYLASGMLDKAHIGSSSLGLVHCTYEAFGPQTAAHLLNGISYLANRLLKFTAFTMGLKDILLSDQATAERTRRFDSLHYLGLCAFADAFELKPHELDESNVKRLYRRAQFAPETDQTMKKRLGHLDLAIKDRLKRAQDAVCDSAIPAGLYVGFPENNLQLMVHVGAKGGMVNAQQMSVALGQIELEGRRVPLMLSGKTLPSFPPYDVRPRAGGMCTARFLTSLPAQELFFHSMAGRDGLVDTAVKTSRSGYLQRSAIKHLEDLSIVYDGTVRDTGNNVIQFRYGDDGVDVCQSAFLQTNGLHFFADNSDLFRKRWHVDDLDGMATAAVDSNRCLFEPIRLIADQVGVKRQTMIYQSMSAHRITKLFRRSKKAQLVMESCQKSECSPSIKSDPDATVPASYPEAPCSLAAELRELCQIKLIHAQAPPGDPVGLLAAQSVGEPSTQMTLNTFHFAGRGEMNVTLGIPRLREILMTGSPNISTPCMEVPIRATPEAQQLCVHIAKRFYKLKLAETLHLPIGERVDYVSDSCTLEFDLQPRSAYADRSHMTPGRVLRFIEHVLFPDLARKLDEELKDQGKINQIKSYALSALARQEQTANSKSFKDDENRRVTADDDDENEALMPTRSRARDEWNEDDGHEAIRRRRLEALNEELDDGDDDEEGAGGSHKGIKVDFAVDDDDELAELEEIAMAELSRSKSRGSRSTAQNAGDENDDEDSGRGSPDLLIDEDDDDDDDELVSAAAIRSDDKKVEDEIRSRVMFVTSLHARFSKYEFDHKHSSPKWARLTICMFDPKEGRISIDLKTLVMRIVNRSVVSSVPGIDRILVDQSNSKEWMFRVEGINMNELIRYSNVFDLNRLYTNSISVMGQTYGIEAARATIQKEVSGVFGHYGIYVNSRHLSLIADYMTKSGVYRAFNRHALVSHPSPLQQMSFETVTNALKMSIQEDCVDNLVSPSASLMVGRLAHNAGTNCFELYQKLSCF